MKMVLQFFGKDISEEELAKYAGTTEEEGTEAEDMVAASRQLGFMASIIDKATWDELKILVKAGLPPIVDWWSTSDGHYSVVVDIADGDITIADPETGKYEQYTRERWMRNWFDFRSSPVHEQGDLLIRRLIVVVA